MDQKIALVTGANKGIGLEIARQLGHLGYRVLLGCRDEGRAGLAVNELSAEGIDCEAIIVDTADSKSIDAAVAEIASRYDRLDVLVNNAGVLLDTGVTFPEVGEDVLRNTFEANFFGPWRLTQGLLNLLEKSSAPRVVNQSSILGSQEFMATPGSPIYNFDCPAYNASKAALNTLTLQTARSLGSRAKVNSAHPGYVATDMTNPSAPLTPKQGAETAVWLATLDNSGPTAGFFHGREPLPW